MKGKSQKPRPLHTECLHPLLTHWTRLCRLGLENLASLKVGGFKQRKKKAHPLYSSPWAMVKTWLRVSMKAMWGVMAVVRLEGGRKEGRSKEMGRLWEQTIAQT